MIANNALSKYEHEYFNETTEDGINIKVVGNLGVIPNSATLDENNNEIELDGEIKLIFNGNKISNKNLDTHIYYTSINEDNTLVTEKLESKKEDNSITTTINVVTYFQTTFVNLYFYCVNFMLIIIFLCYSFYGGQDG